MQFRLFSCLFRVEGSLVLWTNLLEDLHVLEMQDLHLSKMLENAYKWTPFGKEKAIIKIKE